MHSQCDSNFIVIRRTAALAYNNANYFRDEPEFAAAVSRACSSTL